jgi:predicted TIM-barrel enzyme
VKVLADVDVKHSAPLAARDIADEVDDTVKRGLGRRRDRQRGAGTGKKTDPDKVRAVKGYAGADVPVFVGSGITAETIAKHARSPTGSSWGPRSSVTGIPPIR